MSGQPSAISAITLFVDDLERSTAFYHNAFGRPLIFQDADSTAFRFENAIVNLLTASAAGELMAPAPVGASGGGARFVLTITVDDVDRVCADLADRDIPLINGPMDRPWGIRTASFADPDGTVWELAQELPAGGGR